MSFARALLLLTAFAVHAADAPQWGQAWSRNMVSPERGLPAGFDPATGRNIKWTAQLGNESHGTPIIGGGRVYVGTNNREPRNPRHLGDRGVLMCFDEKTGAFLWQLLVPKREEDKYHDWPNCGWSSPVTIEGDRVYTITSRGEVACLDAHGMANGNDGLFRDEAAHMVQQPLSYGDSNQTASPLIPPGAQDADILWLFNMTRDAGIWSHDGAHSSVLIYGNHLYLNTGTGVDNTHRKIRTPDAPSLIVLDKQTGRYLARDEERIAPEIFHCTWSAPSLGVIDGRPVIFFCGGNGMIYGFEPLPTNAPPREAAAPLKLRKLFQFDPDPAAPKTNVHRYTTNRREGPSNIFGMPVCLDGRLYVAGGGDIFWGKNEAWLQCIDATRLAPGIQTNALWSYALEKHVMSTPAVVDGLVFIADVGRRFHCVEAKTGRALWTHDIKGEVWASPYAADGKVYLGTRSGNFYTFAAAREKQVLAELHLGAPVSGTATAANGVLYIATMQNLIAVAEGKER
jgi:outer membrane protein assembly factor BamB